jgi:hypothetical protein
VSGVSTSRSAWPGTSTAARTATIASSTRSAGGSSAEETAAGRDAMPAIAGSISASAATTPRARLPAGDGARARPAQRHATRGASRRAGGIQATRVARFQTASRSAGTLPNATRRRSRNRSHCSDRSGYRAPAKELPTQRVPRRAMTAHNAGRLCRRRRSEKVQSCGRFQDQRRATAPRETVQHDLDIEEFTGHHNP